jgi:glycosyltransferase involved in cell wall biosynthesis
MNYKVSIISSIYNSEKYLIPFLESVVNQTLKDIEIILINDNSPDNSLDILKAYKKKYPTLIKLINLKENIGGGGALNKGIDIAQGEYVSFVDPDDYVDITMCEKLYLKAKNFNADIVQFNYTKIYEDELRLSKRKIKRYNKDNRVIPDEYFNNGEMQECYKKDCILLEMHIGPHWSRFYARDLIKKIRFQPGVIFFDFAMISLPILLADKIIKLSDKFYFYRQRLGCAGDPTIHMKSSLINHISGVKFHIRECQRLNIYERYKDQIITFVIIMVTSRCIFPFMLSVRYRNVYKWQFIPVIKNHIKEIESLYPSYTTKLFNHLGKHGRLILNLLFSYPRVTSISLLFFSLAWRLIGRNLKKFGRFVKKLKKILIKIIIKKDMENQV